MEIKDLNKYSLTNEKKEYDPFTHDPSFFQRNGAAIIDSLIVILIRIFIGSIVAFLWFYFKWKYLLPLPEMSIEEMLKYLISKGVGLDIVIISILIIVLGGLYYVFCFSSSGATLGFTVADLKLVRKDEKDERKIPFWLAFLRYILHLMPVIFIILIVIKYKLRQFDLTFLILALATFLWYDSSLIIKNYRGMPDFITQTKVISTKKRKKLFSSLRQIYGKK